MIHLPRIIGSRRRRTTAQERDRARPFWIKADERTASIPVVAVTASATRDFEQDVIKVCDDYLRKPVVIDDLLETLTKYLDHEAVQEQVSADASADPLSSEDIVDRDSLVSLLISFSQSSLPGLKKTMIVGELEEAAKYLSSLGEKHQFQGLVQRAGALKNAAEMIDIAKIPEALSAVEQIINEVVVYE